MKRWRTIWQIKCSKPYSVHRCVQVFGEEQGEVCIYKKKRLEHSQTNQSPVFEPLRKIRSEIFMSILPSKDLGSASSSSSQPPSPCPNSNHGHGLLFHPQSPPQLSQSPPISSSFEPQSLQSLHISMPNNISGDTFASRV